MCIRILVIINIVFLNFINAFAISDSSYRQILTNTVWVLPEDYCSITFVSKDSIYEIGYVSLDRRDICYDKNYIQKVINKERKEVEIVWIYAYGFYDSSLIRYGEDSLKDSGKYMYQYWHSFKDIKFTETEMTTSDHFGYKVIDPYEFHLSADRQHLLLKFTNHRFYYKEDAAGFTDVDYNRIYGLPKKVIEVLKARGLKNPPPVIEFGNKNTINTNTQKNIVSSAIKKNNKSPKIIIKNQADLQKYLQKQLKSKGINLQFENKQKSKK